MKKPEIVPRVMSVQEAIERYAGEWVLMDITESDELLKTTGRIVCHSPDGEAAALARSHYVRATEGPIHVFLFEAIQPIANGDELRTLLKEALESPEVQERGIVGAWRHW
jgi:hypothetical protein